MHEVASQLKYFLFHAPNQIGAITLKYLRLTFKHRNYLNANHLRLTSCINNKRLLD